MSRIYIKIKFPCIHHSVSILHATGSISWDPRLFGDHLAFHWQSTSLAISQRALVRVLCKSKTACSLWPTHQHKAPGNPVSPRDPSHLQTTYLVQVLLEPPVHLPHQIAVLHDDAPFVCLCPPQSAHQLLFAPLQQLLVVYFGDVLRRTLCAFGQLLLLLLCAFLHPF